MLNKSELVNEDAWKGIEAKVLECQRNNIKSIKTSFGKVDSAILLGLGAEAELDVGNRRSHHDGEHEHDHDDFDSFVLEFGELESSKDLDAQLRLVIQNHDVLRMKGFVALKNKSMRLAVQVVGNRVESYFDKAWTAGEARYSRIVIIGFAGMDKNEIGKILSF